MSMYETDFARWAAEQAGLLRAGLVNSIDFKNLAEEVEDMGKSELRSLEKLFAGVDLPFVEVVVSARAAGQFVAGDD